MICKFCGMPLSSGKCFRCGHHFDSGSAKSVSDGSRTLSSAEVPIAAYVPNVIEPKPVRNYLAIAGMVIALWSLGLFPFAVCALIISIAALVKSRSMDGVGRREATVGTVIGGIMTVATPIILAIWKFPPFYQSIFGCIIAIGLVVGLIVAFTSSHSK